MDTVTRDKDAAFARMADRIVAQSSSDVSSAYVILPPDADPISSLVLDTKRDQFMFWTNLKTLAEFQLRDLAEQEQRRGVGWTGGLR